jgi:ABC-2 type transport system permease protein
MGKFIPLAKIQKKGSLKKAFLNLALGAGNITEILLVVFIWYLIFNDNEIFSGFTIEEIFAYLLLGGIIGMLSGYFLYKIIKKDIQGDRSAMLAKHPLFYLGYLLKKNIGKIIVPFAVYTLLNLFILSIFVDNLALSAGGRELSIFFIMIILAFLIEYLLAYLINMHIFWTIESENLYLALIRLKKLMAGAFFPLNILKEQTMILFLALPFAYSFYVPTQLLLGNIAVKDASRGLLVQSAWIILLYMAIRISRPRDN